MPSEPHLIVLSHVRDLISLDIITTDVKELSINNLLSEMSLGNGPLLSPPPPEKSNERVAVWGRRGGGCR